MIIKKYKINNSFKTIFIKTIKVIFFNISKNSQIKRIELLLPNGKKKQLDTAPK